MPHDPNGANGEAVPAANAPSAIDALLTAYLAESRAIRRLDAAHADAMKRLPAWAVPGPAYLDHEGRPIGPEVGWPMVEAPGSLPEAGVVRLVRPSPRELWRRRALDMLPKDRPERAEGRRRQRLAAIAAMRDAIARIRRQREERRTAGLDEIGNAMEVSCSRMMAVQRDLAEAAAGTTAPEIAATILLNLPAVADCDARLALQDEGFAVLLDLLRHLSPALSGTLRSVVDDLLSDDHRRFGETMIGGAEPAGQGDAH